MRQEKENVRAFYDTFGWQKGKEDQYKDTAAFVDLRPVVRAYEHRAHLRAKRFFQPAGRYFLDAASGAIPHPEYLEYSSEYRWRVCVDLSEKALQEARLKLGGRGFCVLADVTRLPFKDGAFDAILSAHTIYHVPADEQLSALREFERTLHASGSCVVIYTWPSRLIDAVVSSVKRLRRIGRTCKKALKRVVGKSEIAESTAQTTSSNTEAPLPQLYSHAHHYDWFKDNLPKSWNVELRCWSSIDIRFTKALISDGSVGGFILNSIFAIEDSFPRLTARVGRYPMFVIRKPRLPTSPSDRV